jgi:hypothetical protein
MAALSASPGVVLGVALMALSLDAVEAACAAEVGCGGGDVPAPSAGASAVAVALVASAIPRAWTDAGSLSLRLLVVWLWLDGVGLKEARDTFWHDALQLLEEGHSDAATAIQKLSPIARED